MSSTPIPVCVLPLESRDEEEGVPEKSVIHLPDYRQERQIGPRFAEPHSLEWEVLFTQLLNCFQLSIN
jgi:proline- and glutamine-rich splicing factor